MRKVTGVKVLDGYRLDLTFDDGAGGVVDLSHLAPVLGDRGVFAPWLDRKTFEAVRIGESGELAWGDEIDLCPDALYLKATGKKAEDVFPAMHQIMRPPMPEISRFFGIVIKMFFDEHNPPHFHAEYGEDKALVDIRTLSAFAGRLPPRVTGLVIERATLHRQELMDDWKRARAQEALRKIEPLE